MPLLHPLTVDLLLLAVTALLISINMRRLHYRDAPYLFPKRCLLWASLSVVAHGAVLVCVLQTVLERYSLVWWLLVALGGLPILWAFGYALLVTHHPRRMAQRNKSRWKGSELVS